MNRDGTVGFGAWRPDERVVRQAGSETGAGIEIVIGYSPAKTKPQGDGKCRLN